MLLMSPQPALAQEAAAPRTEGELLEELKTGSVRAVGEAYDLHHEAVRRFSTRLVGEPSVAEDLVQDVFVALPKSIARFRGDSSLKTFLISIAINLSKRHIRSATRRRAAMQRAALAHDEGADAGPPVGKARSPEHEASRKELAQALTRALDSLSKDHRVAFVLCEVEQKTSSEAAEVTGVPEGTIRTRLFHAKKKLRRKLELEGWP